MAVPPPDQPVSYGQDIKGLFRPRDRQSMTFAFDLWEVDDVRANAEAILERLKDGTMPCDGEWSEEQVGLFERWVASGMPD